MIPDFNKGDGLVPAIVQHADTKQVLMLGYMNEDAYRRTCDTGLVTFYSRSKQRLWVKGETSGHLLHVAQLLLDCDNDTLLIQALPAGPACHTGSVSCFAAATSGGYLYALQRKINDRMVHGDEASYTQRLFRKGINKMAQKVGEEAVELVIEAKDNNRELFTNEAADLLYHLLILFQAKGVRLEEVEAVLMGRGESRERQSQER